MPSSQSPSSSLSLAHSSFTKSPHSEAWVRSAPYRPSSLTAAQVNRTQTLVYRIERPDFTIIHLTHNNFLEAIIGCGTWRVGCKSDGDRHLCVWHNLGAYHCPHGSQWGGKWTDFNTVCMNYIKMAIIYRRESAKERKGTLKRCPRPYYTFVDIHVHPFSCACIGFFNDTWPRPFHRDLVAGIICLTFSHGRYSVCSVTDTISW